MKGEHEFVFQHGSNLTHWFSHHGYCKKCEVKMSRRGDYKSEPIIEVHGGGDAICPSRKLH